MSRWLNFLLSLAEQCDKISWHYFNQTNLKVRLKFDNSPVSAADQAIEEFIRQKAQKHPLHPGLLGEEYGESGATDLRMIVDPIDGTRNFIRGIPIFATLLAIEEHGEITCGVVSAPALGSRWYGAKGQGAYHYNKLNRKKTKLQVSSLNDLSASQLFHGSLSGNEATGINPKIQKILLRSARQRGYGDFYQHLLVAQGSGEAAFDPLVKPWDIAPLKLILEEAGGKFSAFNGKDSIYAGTALSSNGKMHRSLLKLLM